MHTTQLRSVRRSSFRRSWLVLATLTSLSASSAWAAFNAQLQSQSFGSTNWSAANAAGWAELDFIPMRVFVTGGVATNRTITVQFDHIRTQGSTVLPGIQNLFFFTPSSNVVVTAAPTLSSPPGQDVWSYTFTINLTNTAAGFVEFRARLAAGAHLFTGNSLNLGGSPSLGNIGIQKPAASAGAPDVAIVKTGPANANPGATIAYSITYSNALSSTLATGVQLSDTLPTEVTFVSCSGGCAPLGNTITWDLGNLPRGASGVVTYQVMVTNTITTGFSFHNNAFIASAENDINPTNNFSSVTTTVTSNCIPPSIVVGPADTIICGGGSATFSVLANGSVPLSYQWRIGGAAIAGATSDMLTASNSGSYDVIVSNICGTATSLPATLTSGGGPVINTQPASDARCLGDSAVFLVDASGQSLTYQWRKNNGNIAGATNSLYEIPSVAAPDVGGYDVIINSACGMTTSTVATLTVNVPPMITGDPSGATLCAGDSTNLSVSAAGTMLAFQWRKDGLDISGATNDGLSVSDAGNYDVVVAGICNPAVTSMVATVTVNLAPAITQDPTGTTVCTGAPLSLSVAATGTALTYQWRKDSLGIAGATNDSISIASASVADASSYDVVVTGACSPPATSAVAVVTVKSVPVAVADGYKATEDTTQTVVASGVLGNDSDADSDAMTAVLISSPGHGNLTLNPNGSFTYTPDPNFNGADSFTYRAQDDCGQSGTATVSLNVAAVNDPPVANADSYNTTEDTTLNVPATGVLGNDSDADADILSAILISGPTHGTLLLDLNGSFTYTPTANFHGGDSFTYKANDGTADSAPATVTITVTSVNDAPVATADSYSTSEDTALTVPATGVLANDTDVDGDTLSAILGSGPTHGTLLLDPNGSFTYTPAANFHGSDSFTYKANDGTADSAPTTVTIMVTSINDAPVATADSYSTSEDTTLTVPASGVLANDSDGDGDALTAVLVTGTAHGTLTLNPNGSFTYTPAANFNGSDSFTYRANDGIANSGTATVTITVAGANDTPVATADGYSTVEDTALNVTAPGVLGNDTDLDGDSLTVALVTGPGHGTLTLNPNGSFTYTPAANFNGTDSFTYRVNDGTTNSAAATVTITVTSVNDAPVANPNNYNTSEDTTLNVSAPGVLANDTDVDGDSLNAAFVSGPSHGTLTLNANGSFTYTPASNFNGTDTFAYKANDGTADSAPATVTITVGGLNDAPIALPDSFTTAEDTTLNVPAVGVLANDTDADGDTLSTILVSSTTHGTLTLSPNGSFTYTPAANFHGSDSFSYRANDGVANSAAATVSITVTSVNDVPVANADNYSTAEDTALSVPASGVLGNDTDLDGDALSAALVSAAAHGTVTLNANGSFLYTPVANFHGTDSFTYRVNDGTTDSVPATVTITVTSVNNAPVTSADSYSTSEDTTLNVPAVGVLANDSDVDGDVLTAILLAGTTHGTLTLNPNGSFSYTPAANFHGSDSFTYKANDGTADSAPATVSITVTAGNDAPVASADNYSATEDTTLAVPATGVLANDSDVDGDALSAVLVTGTVHGTLTLNPNGSFSYTPAANFNGSDSFTYKASDGTAQSSAVTVNINVGAVNDVPVAVDDSLTIAEGSGMHSIDVLANDADSDGDALAITGVGSAGHGTVFIVANRVSYTPGVNFNGSDSFTYTISDGNGGTASASVSVTVTAVNDAPVAGDDSYQMSENDTLTVDAPGVLGNDHDAEGATLTATLASGPAHGTVTLNVDGSFTYMPDDNYNGPDSFTYRDSDGALDSNVATVNIYVLSVLGAGDVDLYVKTAKARVNWATSNADSLVVRGQINPRGVRDNLAGATVTLRINNVDVLASETLDARGASANCRLKNTNGRYSIRLIGADLRNALGLVNANTGGFAVMTVRLTINGADLEVPVTTAQLECPFQTTANKASRLKFNFRKNRTLSGAFNANKTVGSASSKEEFVSIKGVVTAENSGWVIPTGSIVIRAGNSTSTLPLALLTHNNGVWRYSGTAAAGLTRFVLSNTGRNFLLTASSTDIGLPAAGSGAAVKHNLPLQIQVPTADGTMIFESIIELRRSRESSTHWKR